MILAAAKSFVDILINVLTEEYILDAFSDFKNEKRISNAYQAINRLLESEKGNSYYNQLDRILCNSKILQDCVFASVKGIKSEASERIKTLLAKEQIETADAARISEVILRLGECGQNVLLAPDTAEEGRVVARIDKAKDEIIVELQKQLDEMKEKIGGEKSLSPQQYARFEENVKKLYLQGELLTLQNLVLDLENWKALKNLGSLDGIFLFIKIVVNYCLNGLFNEHEITAYLESTASPVIDELFLTLLVSFGTPKELKALSGYCKEKRWDKYRRVFEYMEKAQNGILPLNELKIEDEASSVLSAWCLAHYHHADLPVDLERAYQTLPKTFVVCYGIINEFHIYQRKYAGCPRTEKMTHHYEDQFSKYVELANFFDVLHLSLQRFYYAEMAHILGYTTIEKINQWEPRVTALIKDEKKLIAMRICKWRQSEIQPTEDEITSLLSLIMDDCAAHVMLMSYAYSVYGDTFITKYLDNHQELLEKEIAYVQMALDTGHDPSVLSSLVSSFPESADFYLLCTKDTENFTADQRDQFSLLAIDSFLKNKVIALYSLQYLLEIANAYERIAEIEAILEELEYVQAWRERAKYYAKRKENEKALELITLVVSSDAVNGNDYALQGDLSVSDSVAYEAYKKGYEEWNHYSCMYNLLWLQYKHQAPIDQQLLNAVAAIDDVNMQTLAAHSYIRLNQNEKAFQHAIHALLLSESYHEQHYGLAFKLICENKNVQICNETISETSYAIIEDDQGNRKVFCFYPNPDMLPKANSEFGNASHCFGGYNEPLYMQFVGLAIGHTVFIEGKEYKIKEIGATYGYLFRYCTNEMVKHKSIWVFEGTPEEMIKKLIENVTDSDAQKEELLTKYRDTQNFSFVSYQTIAKKFGCSYVLALHKLCSNHIPLLSVLVHRISNATEYVIGLDTVYLLSQLSLPEEKIKMILSRTTMSDSMFGWYYDEKAREFSEEQKTKAKFFVVEESPVLLEKDEYNPLGELRAFYSPLDAVMENVKHRPAMFDVPEIFKNSEDVMTDLYGQAVLDNYQLVSDTSCMITNDRAVSFLSTFIPNRGKVGTVLNLLSRSKLTLDELILCLKRLTELNYVGILCYEFFKKLSDELEILYAEDALDLYEEKLAKIVECVGVIVDTNEGGKGDLRSLIQEFFNDNLEKRPLVQILAGMYAQTLSYEELIDAVQEKESAID